MLMTQRLVLAASAMIGAAALIAPNLAEAFDGGANLARGGYGASMQQASLSPTNLSTELNREVQPTRALVPDPTEEKPGTITVDTKNRYLYLSLEGGQAMRYDVGVGREGFEWRGRAFVGRRAMWPTWTPPAAMLKRRPDLPRTMLGGVENPLGARAMYLYNKNGDTMFRIHGTNEPDTIGQAVSSGCIRLLNEDIVDLYERVKVGAPVIVL